MGMTFLSWLSKDKTCAKHCVKSVKIRSFFWFVFSCIQCKYRKYGPEKAPYLDPFHAVKLSLFWTSIIQKPLTASMISTQSFSVENPNVFLR